MGPASSVSGLMQRSLSTLGKWHFLGTVIFSICSLGGTSRTALLLTPYCSLYSLSYPGMEGIRNHTERTASWKPWSLLSTVYVQI